MFLFIYCVDLLQLMWIFLPYFYLLLLLWFSQYVYKYVCIYVRVCIVLVNYLICMCCLSTKLCHKNNLKVISLTFNFFSLHFFFSVLQNQHTDILFAVCFICLVESFFLLLFYLVDPHIKPLNTHGTLHEHFYCRQFYMKKKKK